MECIVRNNDYLTEVRLIDVSIYGAKSRLTSLVQPHKLRPPNGSYGHEPIVVVGALGRKSIMLRPREGLPSLPEPVQGSSATLYFLGPSKKAPGRIAVAPGAGTGQ